MKHNILCKQIALTLLALTSLLPATQSFAEGNHTWAKSEAWTWMGHVNKLEVKDLGWSLKKEGFAYIHYFTRNETGFGRMNFKSSAVTTTMNDLGIAYDKKTTYPNALNHKFKLKVREDRLDIEFEAPSQHDVVKEVEFQKEDLILLKNKILPLYTGLEISPGWSLKKFEFVADMGQSHKVNLQMFAIWPDIAPPGQQMEFFGIKDSYTYSSPMLITYGDWSVNGGPAEKVVGLSFLDRQWSKDYFGKNIFNDPTEFFMKNHALKWAHNWSAFHAYSPVSKDWYFVHLWQQVQRQDFKSDERANYTGVQWSKNGIQQPAVLASSFEWMPTQYVRNESKVLMNFASGREAYFPKKYTFMGKDDDTYFELEASPALQSLDQPIYLYEGYAKGKGVWDQQLVEIRGRVESSQILFRKVDYIDMLKTIDTSDPEQAKVAEALKMEVNAKNTPASYFEEQQAQQDYLTNDMYRKQQIFSAQFQSKPEQVAPNVLIYF